MGRLSRVVATAIIGVSALVVAAHDAGATITTVQSGGSIQAAIDASAAGDTILVGPGTYLERLDFGGRAIQVRSTDGPASTVIDAGASSADRGTAVTFDDGEPRAAVLEGFTITGGWATADGAGIEIAQSAPTIRGNVVEGNVGCTGVGIHNHFSSSRIEGNVIRGNSSVPTGYSGCRGGGVYIGGASSAELVGNEIADNVVDAGGGGLELNASSDVLVSRNLIRGNTADRGAGIETANANSGRFEQNVIRDNHAGVSGGGVSFTSSATNAFSFVNNTVTGNSAGVRNPGADFAYFNDAASFVNNVFEAAGGPAFVCGASYQSDPAFRSNTFWSGVGAAPTNPECPVPFGAEGTQVTDPELDSTGVPGAGSPVIDSGVPVVLESTLDVLGGARVVDGDGDGVAVIDRGAVEALDAVVPPSPPRNLVASFQKRSRASVAWSAPADDGGSPVTGYELQVVETGEQQVLGGDRTSATISGVSSNRSYEIRLFAVNEVGRSAPATFVLGSDGGDGGGDDGGGPKCHPKRGC